MKKTLLLAATLMVALPGTGLADPPVEPGQPPIIQIFPGPRAVPAPAIAIAPATQKVHRAPNGKAFPANWDAPPLRQTRDLRPLP
ncbi:MAG: hypothetical protein MK293_14395, partial [Pedosphaera sp.]|nr:hypothetical protein [Pedosphaera sp.]